MTITLAQTELEVRECWPLMMQLQRNLSEPEFVEAVHVQRAEGYRLAFIRPEQKVAAVAGFRIQHNLAWGRFCHLDDLVTDEQVRSQGLGSALLEWLCQFARAEGCKRLELQSGVQRFGAHRFYLRHGMFISCHHFSLKLGEDAGPVSINDRRPQ